MGGRSLVRRDLFNDLRTLTRATSPSAVLTLEDAAVALQVSRREATLRMRALIRLGAVRRISKGLFFLVSIRSQDPASECPRDVRGLQILQPFAQGLQFRSEFAAISFRSLFVHERLLITWRRPGQMPNVSEVGC